MPIVDLASFPNSRIKNRPATSLATTGKLEVLPGANRLLLDADANRTYVELRNLGPCDIVYGYSDDPLLIDNGELLRADESVKLESPQTIYALNLGGVATYINFDKGVG